MAPHTETDRLLGPLDHPVPVIKILLTDGLCAPLSRESAPIQSVAVTRGGLLIGREVSSHQGIPLPNDRNASARHARVWLHDDGQRVLIEDLGSKNKTYVNGQLVTHGELPDRSVIRVGNSLLFLLFRHSMRPPRKLPDDTSPTAQRLRGQSPEMVELRYQLTCAAERDAPVLLIGETGTGKELSAEFLHQHSPQRDGPFLAINCATIQPALAESTLFGHVQGAFTGAITKHSGLFRQARDGTLFLDEVADLPLDVQPMLLRALEEKVIRPVGSVALVPCPVRVVAATNLNLEEAARRDSFRVELLARLSMLRIELPSLRQRKEDILPLFAHYLGGTRRMTARLGEALLLYAWPQNVRELIAVTEYVKTYEDPEGKDSPLDLLSLPARFRSESSALQPSSAKTPVASQPAADSSELREQSSQVAEHARPNKATYDESLLRQYLLEFGGLIAPLARRLKLSRRQVGRVLRRLGIDPKLYRRGGSQRQPEDAEDADDAPDDVDDDADDDDAER
jgi:DNA-binding NtrC family response regulator